MCVFYACTVGTVVQPLSCKLSEGIGKDYVHCLCVFHVIYKTFRITRCVFVTRMHTEQEINSVKINLPCSGNCSKLKQAEILG